MTMSTVIDITVQKQLVYNKLLPYSDLLADESSQRLSIIKGNLGRSIQLRDFDIGTVHWVAQLSRFVCFHFRKCSRNQIEYVIVNDLFKTTSVRVLNLINFCVVMSVELCKSLS